MQSINLQKSLEKLAVLNLLEERLDGNNTLIGICLKGAINGSVDTIFQTIKDMDRDNHDTMIKILGEPLIEKILCL